MFQSQVLKGRDVIAQAQSGTGKTATFSISILQSIDTTVRETQVLVLSPTRELAVQIQKVVLALGDYMNVQVSLLSYPLISSTSNYSVITYKLTSSSWSQTTATSWFYLSIVEYCNTPKPVGIDSRNNLLKKSRIAWRIKTPRPKCTSMNKFMYEMKLLLVALLS